MEGPATSTLPHLHTSALRIEDTHMIQEALRKVTSRENLTQEEAAAVMTEIMEEKATHVQIGGLLTALRTKGETADELTGFAEVMRSRSVKVEPAKRPL